MTIFCDLHYVISCHDVSRDAVICASEYVNIEQQDRSFRQIRRESGCQCLKVL